MAETPTLADLTTSVQKMIDDGKPEEEIAAFIRAAQQAPPSFWDKHPTIASGLSAVLSSLPGAGAVIGGLLGTPADLGTGPVGTIAGAGLGMGAGKGAENAIRRFTGLGGPKTLDEGVDSVVKSAATGATLAAGGEALPTILPAAYKALNPVHIAEDLDKTSLLEPVKPLAGVIRRFAGALDDAPGANMPTLPKSANFPGGAPVVDGEVIPPATSPAPASPQGTLPPAPGGGQALLPPAGAIQQPPSSLTPPQALPAGPGARPALGPATSTQLPASSLEQELMAREANAGAAPATTGAKPDLMDQFKASLEGGPGSGKQSFDMDGTTYVPNEQGSHVALGRDATVPEPAAALVPKAAAGPGANFSDDEIALAEKWAAKGVSADDIVKRILATRELAAHSPSIAEMPGDAQMASEILKRNASGDWDDSFSR